jgi:hypothetical protein
VASEGVVINAGEGLGRGVRTDHFAALDEVYCLVVQHGRTILGEELGRESICQECEQCSSQQNHLFRERKQAGMKRDR